MNHLPNFYAIALPLLLPEATKQCRKCGLKRTLSRFPFHKTTQQYGSPCKVCRAEAMKAFRASPQHAERLRQQECARSAARAGYIRSWHADHPEALRAAQVRHRQRRAGRLPDGAAR